MQHRLTAWMALFAMLTGIAMPAHAYRIHAAPGMPDANFCTAAKPADAAVGNNAAPTTGAPAPGERDHGAQCDACCGCVGAAAAPALPRFLSNRVAALAVPADLPPTRQSAVAGRALARGPPART